MAAGIINYATGTYRDPITGKSMPIAQAIAEGLIHVETTRITKHEEETHAIGLMTVQHRVDKRRYDYHNQGLHEDAMVKTY